MSVRRSITLSDGGSAINSAGFLHVPDDGKYSRLLQISLAGPGVVSASIQVLASLDGNIYAPIATVSLSGEALCSEIISIQIDGIWLQVRVSAISGNGSVTASVR